ncbi:MAG: 3-methyl-2-oxobutanoate hydroxymethyltransferase [Actinomycetota bacterium]
MAFDHHPSLQDVRSQRGVRTLLQVHTDHPDEASACHDAGIDIVGADTEDMLAATAAAAPNSFIWCGIPHATVAGPDDALRVASRMHLAGADAVYCSLSPRLIEVIAAEGIPVVGHIGLVPNRATWTNFRAFGKTADEARQLYIDMKRLESAGAACVEIEVVPPNVATALTQRTSLVTMSMGSGTGCDTQYLFSADILGENEGHVPRHAKVYADLAARRRELHHVAVSALAEWATEVTSGAFPTASHLVEMGDAEQAQFDEFLDGLD